MRSHVVDVSFHEVYIPAYEAATEQSETKVAGCPKSNANVYSFSLVSPDSKLKHAKEFNFVSISCVQPSLAWYQATVPKPSRQTSWQ